MGTKPQRLTPQSTAVNTTMVRVRLDQLDVDHEKYCNRQATELTPANLASLLLSIRKEGLQTPLEVFQHKSGRYLTIKGARRRECLLHLAADEKEAAFTSDMLIDAVEVQNASEKTLLLRAVSDNENRRNFSQEERITIAKKFFDLDISAEDAAVALGVGEATFKRDLRIAQHDWAFQFVKEGSIHATYAALLLAAAEEHGRIQELHEDLAAWITSKSHLLHERDRQLRLTGKDSKAASKLVRTFMSKQLVDHWLRLLREGQRFDEDIVWTYRAAVDDDKKQLRIDSISLDLTRIPADQLALLASQLSKVIKDLKPLVRRRMQEGPTSGGSDAQSSYPFDVELLRELGMEGAVQKLLDSAGTGHDQSETSPGEEVSGAVEPDDEGEGDSSPSTESRDK